MGIGFKRITVEHTLVPVPATMDPQRPDGAMFLVPWPEADEDAEEDADQEEEEDAEETDSGRARRPAASVRQARFGKDVTSRVLGDPPPHRAALAQKA